MHLCVVTDAKCRGCFHPPVLWSRPLCFVLLLTGKVRLCGATPQQYTQANATWAPISGPAPIRGEICFVSQQRCHFLPQLLLFPSTNCVWTVGAIYTTLFTSVVQNSFCLTKEIRPRGWYYYWNAGYHQPPSVDEWHLPSPGIVLLRVGWISPVRKISRS